MIQKEYFGGKAQRTAVTLTCSLDDKVWTGGNKWEKRKTAAKERNIKEGNCRKERRGEMRTNKEKYEKREKVIPDRDFFFSRFLM